MTVPDTAPTVVLLGAGASVPAGVPAAIPMTEKMLRLASEERDPLIERSLHVICGALQTHMAAFSADRSYSPDIERVLDAAQQLGERKELELTPFVATWHPAVLALEKPAYPSVDGRRIVSDALSSVRGATSQERIERELVAAFGGGLNEMMRALSRGPDSGVFRELATFLTSKLLDVAWLRTTDSLTYLEPMISAGARGRITIATLNYDNAIELKAQEQSVVCHTGLAEWNASGSLPCRQDGIELIKLHGSVNWSWKAMPGAGDQRELVELATRDEMTSRLRSELVIERQSIPQASSE